MRLAFFDMGPVGGSHMRLLLFATGVFVVVMCAERPAEAQNYPWCAYYGPHFGATNCGFATFQQCSATVSGIGGVILIEGLQLPQKLRQLGDIRRNPLRLQRNESPLGLMIHVWIEIFFRFHDLWIGISVGTLFQPLR